MHFQRKILKEAKCLLVNVNSREIELFETSIPSKISAQSPDADEIPMVLFKQVDSEEL